MRRGVKSSEFVQELREIGVSIGKGTVFFSPLTTTVDITRPWLVTIGEYTKITAGVIILTHDYSLSVLRRRFGPWIGEGAETKIGDNCFIGMNSIILMGTNIGNNVIIGAGSVVHGTIPDDVVVAGNPAKVICTLEEHYWNRYNKTKEEAINCALIFENRKGRMPTPHDLEGFKFLFTPRSEETVREYGLSFLCNGDEPSDIEKEFYASAPIWKDFDDFLNEVESRKR